jgi:hypothetical protein
MPPKGGRGRRDTPCVFITAFGETKSLSDWSRDRRCKVTLHTLRERLDGGMAPERAIAAAGGGGRAVSSAAMTSPRLPGGPGAAFAVQRDGHCWLALAGDSRYARTTQAHDERKAASNSRRASCRP